MTVLQPEIGSKTHMLNYLQFIVRKLARFDFPPSPLH